MEKQEYAILERIEKKQDKQDEKQDKLDEKISMVIEKYIIPHEEFIKSCRERQGKEDKKKENKIARIISIGIALFSSFVAICIAIFK